MTDPVTQGGPDLPPLRLRTPPHGLPGLELPELSGPLFAGPLFAGPAEEPDRYELVGPGRAGGEGITWRARYRGGLQSPLPLALKLLRPPPGADPSWPTAEDRRRWRDQTAVLRHLRIGQVVGVNEVFAGPPPHAEASADASADSGVCAYVEMEWVEGPTLAELVGSDAATARTVAQRLEHVAEVARGLACLHSHTRSGGNPSLHRDVSPSNVIVNPERGAVLIDLNTMRLLDDGADIAGRHTPEYTAPEVLGAPQAPREPSADLYALGALTVFCLLGEAPPRATVPGMLDLTRSRILELGRTLGVTRPEALAAHVVAMLEPRPSLRPAAIVPWAQDLLTLATEGVATPATRARHLAWALATAAVAALAASVLLVPTSPLSLTRSTPTPPPANATALPTTPPTLLSATPTPTATSVTTPTPTVAGSAASPTPSSSGEKGAAAADPRPTKKVSRPVGLAKKPPVVTRALGAFATPANNGTVKSCSYFTGTASLPAGQTLILTMQNVSNSTAGVYLDNVFEFEKPASLTAWSGALFFNQDSEGQTYRITVRAVPLAAVVDAKSGTDDQWRALAQMGTELDRLAVTRVAGTVLDNCPGPS